MAAADKGTLTDVASRPPRPTIERTNTVTILQFVVGLFWAILLAGLVLYLVYASSATVRRLVAGDPPPDPLRAPCSNARCRLC